MRPSLPRFCLCTTPFFVQPSKFSFWPGSSTPPFSTLLLEKFCLYSLSWRWLLRNISCTTPLGSHPLFDFWNLPSALKPQRNDFSVGLYLCGGQCAEEFRGFAGVLLPFFHNPQKFNLLLAPLRPAVELFFQHIYFTYHPRDDDSGKKFHVPFPL